MNIIMIGISEGRGACQREIRSPQDTPRLYKSSWPAGNNKFSMIKLNQLID